MDFEDVKKVRDFSFFLIKDAITSGYLDHRSIAECVMDSTGFDCSCVE